MPASPHEPKAEGSPEPGDGFRNLPAGIWNTVWPATLSTDSELQRRQKFTVRCAQSAVAALVLVPVTATIVTGLYQRSALQAGGLVLLSLLYILWSWHGMREPVSRLFGETQAKQPAARVPGVWPGTVIYFVVQLGLAGLICYQSFYWRERPVAWLVLLPPVAHSVILLRRWGITLVSVSSLALLLATVASCYGWQEVPSALLAFPFALLFTLVFTLLAVSSGKARQQEEHLAGELAAANAKLRQYAVQAEELAATRERNRLAGEIHDSLGHYLTVVNVQLEAARALQPRDPPGADAALAKAQALTLEGLQEIRRSVSALRASPLDNRSLTEALRRLVEENRAAGLEAELQVSGAARRLSPQAELTLYRAAQEGLTNVRKHAQTTRARLGLDFRAGAKVLLSVRDQGVGMAPEAPEAVGFGLLGLRERAQLLGGEVRVRPGHNQGFTLEVEVPG
jgi:signal transduction histidine kinase